MWKLGRHQHESRNFSLKMSISIQDKRGIYFLGNLMINMNTIGPVMIFIIGAIICLDNIKVLFRYYVYGITGSMVPFIGGVLLMTGVCLLLNKNLNYKTAILLFDVTFICWPLAIMRSIILWLVKKGGG